jgi:FixJ family two-component response regulator
MGYASGRGYDLKSILVADHDPRTGALCADLVRDAGCTPLVANGRRVQMSIADDLAGLILDVSSRRGVGLRFVPEVRSIKPLLPILVIAGSHTMQAANEAHLLGVEFVCKENAGANIASFVRRCTNADSNSVADLLTQMQIEKGLTLAERRLLTVAMVTSAHQPLADLLGISINTVKKRIGTLLEKTRAPNMEQLVAPLRERALRW